MIRHWTGCVAAVLVSLVVSFAAVPARAGQGGWERLGGRTVEGKADKDVIQVGADFGMFTAIQFKVEGGSLQMFEIKVVFGNGEIFEPKTQLVFEKDTMSKVIDLPGDKRFIMRVEFKYGNLPGGGRAYVGLWGKGLTRPPGWERLGGRVVDSKADKDVIQVGTDAGMFTAIQISVEGASLQMSDIKVVFGNGEIFEPKTQLVYEKDTLTRVIDLPGNKRYIMRVEFKYGNLPGGGKAYVGLWGKD